MPRMLAESDVKTRKTVTMANEHELGYYVRYTMPTILLHVRYTMPTILAESDVKTWKTVSVANELDGFRVLRSSGPPGTLALLAQLTHAITRAYSAASAAAAEAAAVAVAVAAGSARNGACAEDLHSSAHYRV